MVAFHLFMLEPQILQHTSTIRKDFAVPFRLLSPTCDPTNQFRLPASTHETRHARGTQLRDPEPESPLPSRMVYHESCLQSQFALRSPARILGTHFPGLAETGLGATYSGKIRMVITSDLASVKMQSPLINFPVEATFDI
jgi:hypothetical protein